MIKHNKVRFLIMDIYEIKSFDAENFLNFYEQVCDQIWYVFNADRIKKTPVEEQDEEENKRLREVEDKFLIHSEDGYDDIDIGYLFGLYAVLKYYSTNNYSWADIDKEINDLVSRYSILNSTKK